MFRIHRLLSDNPHRASLAIFGILYCLTVLYLVQAASRDPTSAFFGPRHAFEPRYSTVRKEQANWLIEHATNGSADPSPAESPRLAVGIATVQRAGQHYFQTAVGSLLEGLSSQERDEIHLTVLVADADPYRHQAYNESWLHALSDQVVTYNDVPLKEKERIAALEITDVEHRTKPLLDYVYLLQTCYNTGAPFVAMLEDDIIAMDGWYHRTMKALADLKSRHILDEVVYLRLFYDSGLHGWNSERWPSHLLWSMSVTAGVILCLFVLRRHSKPFAAFLTPRTFVVITFICTPLIIGLYYAAGRLTVAPLPLGIRRMDTHGCCSQAFVFPRQRIPELLNHYREQGIGFIDMLTEEYANARDLPRFATVPSVIQHVGAKSSKGDDTTKMQWQRNVAQNIWNFDFELFDEASLRTQHLAELDRVDERYS